MKIFPESKSHAHLILKLLSLFLLLSLFSLFLPMCMNLPHGIPGWCDLHPIITFPTWHHWFHDHQWGSQQTIQLDWKEDFQNGGHPSYRITSLLLTQHRLTNPATIDLGPCWQQVSGAERAAAIATDLRCEHSSFHRHPISAHRHTAVEERVKPWQSMGNGKALQQDWSLEWSEYMCVHIKKALHTGSSRILIWTNPEFRKLKSDLRCVASSVTVGILAKKPWDLPLSAVHRVVSSQAWREFLSGGHHSAWVLCV